MARYRRFGWCYFDMFYYSFDRSFEKLAENNEILTTDRFRLKLWPRTRFGCRRAAWWTGRYRLTATDWRVRWSVTARTGTRDRVTYQRMSRGLHCWCGDRTPADIHCRRSLNSAGSRLDPAMAGGRPPPSPFTSLPISRAGDGGKIASSSPIFSIGLRFCLSASAMFYVRCIFLQFGLCSHAKKMQDCCTCMQKGTYVIVKGSICMVLNYNHALWYYYCQL